MINDKRILILAGHYGSGKTNLAVNLALTLRRQGQRVCIADLDIVNPYFRTVDSGEELTKAGVRLISSEFAESNVDLPALPSTIYSVFTDPGETAVIDVGGDDRGALALGRLRDGILTENAYEMLAVINFARPLTRTVEDALEVMRQVETAAGIPFTGIINNTNLGEETTADYVEASVKKAEALARAADLPLVFTAAKDELCAGLFNKGIRAFPLKLQGKIT